MRFYNNDIVIDTKQGFKKCKHWIDLFSSLTNPQILTNGNSRDSSKDQSPQIIFKKSILELNSINFSENYSRKAGDVWDKDRKSTS